MSRTGSMSLTSTVHKASCSTIDIMREDISSSAYLRASGYSLPLAIYQADAIGAERYS